MDQSSAEACVARFRVQQQTDNTLGLEDLNNIITVRNRWALALTFTYSTYRPVGPVKLSTRGCTVVLATPGSDAGGMQTRTTQHHNTVANNKVR